MLFFFIDEAFLILTAFTPIHEWIPYGFILVLLIACHLIFVLYILWQAFKHKQRYVCLTLVSIIDMVICISIEFINYEYFLFSPLIHSNIFIFGELIFLPFQSYVISADMEEAFLNAQQANKMELAFLQAQISPHFFFNVLNNIYYLLDTNPPMAKNLLIQFND